MNLWEWYKYSRSLWAYALDVLLWLLILAALVAVIRA